MNKIKDSDIKHLGVLARIGIDEAIAKELAPQLMDILDYVSRLQSIDTSGVEITSQVTGLVGIWREDEVKPSLISREELLSNTPETEGGYIKVRKVL
ncbi:MAG: Asp-tRNA(Asn)/Glu-tRNA(Gln) amidotransferase subunit GatC [Candidatus Saccharimonadales bacterium]